MFRDWVYPAYVRVARPRRPRKRSGTDRGRLIQTAAVLCAVLGLNTDTTLIYQLFAFLFCLTVISRYSLAIQKPSVSVRRHLPRYATANQIFKYQISLTNTGHQIESDLLIEDNPLVLPPDRDQFRREKEPGEETRNAYDRFIGFHRFMYLQRLNTGIVIKPTKVPDISLRETVNVTIEAQPMRRGIVYFSSISILHPDPLGLNHGIMSIDASQSLIILPRRYEIARSFTLTSGRHFQPGGVNAAWSIGESHEFVSLRDYRDGDSMRKIHWPSSAKRLKPVVKEYQDEYFVRQALVLDTSSPDGEVLEEAISVAASFTLSMNNTDSMLDLIYLADKPVILTSGRGTSAVNEQLEALATLTHCPHKLEILSETVARHGPLIGSCILILTGWTQYHRQMVQRLKNTKVQTEVFIVTREESSLQDVPESCHVLPLTEIQERLRNL